jgi:hypothetical protein
MVRTTADTYHDIWISSLERWWGESRNPLYVWEAVMRCLCTDPRRPIPDWCLPYLAETALAITDLAWACGRGRMKPDRAAGQVAKATGLARQGVSRFHEIASDYRAMRDALDETRGHEVTKALEAERSVARDRARRIIARGHRLLGSRRSSKPPPKVST